MSDSPSCSTVVKKGFTFRRSSSDAKKAAVNSLTSLIGAKKSSNNIEDDERREIQVTNLEKKRNSYQQVSNADPSKSDIFSKTKNSNPSKLDVLSKSTNSKPSSASIFSETTNSNPSTSDIFSKTKNSSPSKTYNFSKTTNSNLSKSDIFSNTTNSNPSKSCHFSKTTSSNPSNSNNIIKTKDSKPSKLDVFSKSTNSKPSNSNIFCKTTISNPPTSDIFSKTKNPSPSKTYRFSKTTNSNPSNSNDITKAKDSNPSKSDIFSKTTNSNPSKSYNFSKTTNSNTTKSDFFSKTTNSKLSRTDFISKSTIDIIDDDDYENDIKPKVIPPIQAQIKDITSDIANSPQKVDRKKQTISVMRDEKESNAKLSVASKNRIVSNINPQMEFKGSRKDPICCDNEDTGNVYLLHSSPSLKQPESTSQSSVFFKEEESHDTSSHHVKKDNNVSGIFSEGDVSEEDIEQLLALQDDLEAEKDLIECCSGDMDILPSSNSVASESYSGNEISELPYDIFVKSITSKNFSELQRLKAQLDEKIEDCMATWRSLSRKSEELERRLSKQGPTSNSSSADNLLSMQGPSLNSSTASKSFSMQGPSWNNSGANESLLMESPSLNSVGVNKSLPCKTSTQNLNGTMIMNQNQVDKNHPLLPRVQQLLKSSFGLRTFRENQLNAILTVLDRDDCFILMPTGGGKSLCYQLSAVVTDGVTIVVSPLRSLIFDQVQKLKSLKIPAAYLSSDIKPDEEQQVYYELSMMNPSIKLLYLTPEKISLSTKLTSTLSSLYSRDKLDRIVIDEAHCVSQWGHDFRPDYKKLNVLRQKYPRVPIMSLTATATPRVQKDILYQLSMKDTKIFKQSFNRANLQYMVLPKSPKKTLDEMVKKIKTEMNNKSGIIYCFSRKDTDKVALHLRKNGIAAQPYHAGLTDKQRYECHEMWMKNKTRVVCATIAFGMGIDKPDVRFVFHFTLPKSVEGYFQESGRAGRDGLKSTCILYYCYGDMYKIRKMIESDKDNVNTLKVHLDNLNRVVAYCENKIDCRRLQQLHYFGEDQFDSASCKQNINTTCDNCQMSSKAQQLDVTEDAKKIIRSVNELAHGNNSNYQVSIKNYHQRLTLNQFVDAFKGQTNTKGMNLDRLPLCNAGSKYTKMDAERLFRQMVLMRVLAEELVIGQHSNVMAYLKLGPRFSDVLTDQLKVKLSTIAGKSSVVSASSKKRKADELENDEIKDLKEKCLEQLSELRNEIANQNDLANPETIIGINVLRGLADALPSTEDEMYKCIGITENWYQIWGDEFLEVTKSFHEKVAALNLSAPATMLQESHFDDNLGYDDIVQPGKSNPSIGMYNKQKALNKRKYGKGRGRGKRKAGQRKTYSPKKPTTTALQLGLLNMPAKKKAR